MSAGSSPYEVAKAQVQALFLSGRYRTEKLSRFWSENPDGYCLCPSCKGLGIQEDLSHILLHCASLAPTRRNLATYTASSARVQPHLSQILLTFTTPSHPMFIQFLLDCSCIPQVILLTQQHGKPALYQLFKITRTWCYSIHRERLKLLGRWSSFK